MLIFTPLADGTLSVRIKDDYKQSIDSESIVIPAQHNGKPVTQIADNGFKDCRYLKEIVIPETVQVINKYAFDSCPNLKNVALSEGLLRIEEYAFLRNVSEITIPKSVTYIAWHNFWRRYTA